MMITSIFMLIQEPEECNTETVSVTYTVEYPSPTMCTMSPSLGPISVTISKNGSALDVMEASVDVSTYYRFSATYFGNTLGYSIDTINGTSSSDPCYWFFYVQEPGSPMPMLENLGVSNYLIPTDDYSIYMRYEESGAISFSPLSFYLLSSFAIIAFAIANI